jgi:hypothetical protein
MQVHLLDAQRAETFDRGIDEGSAVASAARLGRDVHSEKFARWRALR